MSSIIYRLPKTVSLVLCVVFFLPGYTPAAQADNVSATIFQSAPDKAVITVLLPPQPPPTVIVELKLPPGSHIKKASPQFSKQNNNTLKWLFKNIKDRSLTIKLVTKGTFEFRPSQVLVRYRNKDDGALTEIGAQNK